MRNSECGVPNGQNAEAGSAPLRTPNSATTTHLPPHGRSDGVQCPSGRPFPPFANNIRSYPPFKKDLPMRRCSFAASSRLSISVAASEHRRWPVGRSGVINPGRHAAASPYPGTMPTITPRTASRLRWLYRRPPSSSRNTVGASAAPASSRSTINSAGDIPAPAPGHTAISIPHPPGRATPTSSAYITSADRGRHEVRSKKDEAARSFKYFARRRLSVSIEIPLPRQSRPCARIPPRRAGRFFYALTLCLRLNGPTGTTVQRGQKW